MKRTSGFTVIELISAIVLICVICSLVLLQKNNIDASSRDQQRKTAVNAIYYGLTKAYFVEHGSYPVQASATILPYIDPKSFEQIGSDSNYALHYQGLDCDGANCKGFVITNKLEKEALYKKSSN